MKVISGQALADANTGEIRKLWNRSASVDGLAEETPREQASWDCRSARQ